MADINYDETAEPLQEFIEQTSESLPGNQPPERVARQIKAAYDFDVSDVSESDAQEWVDAVDAGDFESAAEIMRSNDVPEDAIERFRGEIAQLNESAGDGADGSAGPAAGENGAGDPDSVNVSDNAAQGGDGAVSRQEVRQMIADETPDADEIAQSLQNQMGVDGGGGGQPQGEGGGGGMNPQVQQLLAQAISQKFLDGGGGEMAQLGQQVQKAAMNSFINDLQKPSLGDMMEAKLFEDVSEEYAEQYREEMFGDPFDDMDDMEPDDDDGDDGSGGILSW